MTLCIYLCYWCFLVYDLIGHDLSSPLLGRLGKKERDTCFLGIPQVLIYFSFSISSFDRPVYLTIVSTGKLSFNIFLAISIFSSCLTVAPNPVVL